MTLSIKMGSNLNRPKITSSTSTSTRVRTSTVYFRLSNSSVKLSRKMSNSSSRKYLSPIQISTTKTVRIYILTFPFKYIVYYHKSQQSIDGHGKGYDGYGDDDGFSSLGYYYMNHPHAELVYRKMRNLGTSWIGQRQYLTSLFVTP